LCATPLKDIQQLGMESHAEYGTFLLCPAPGEPEQRVVAHMDGRCFGDELWAQKQHPNPTGIYESPVVVGRVETALNRAEGVSAMVAAELGQLQTRLNTLRVRTNKFACV
jgi:hypothetical protein